MIMTFIRGPSFQFPWAHHHTLHHQSTIATMSTQDQIKGSLMITVGCFCWASFVILQAVTLKSYPAQLSLTTLVCMMGSLEGSILAVVAEKANASVWSISWDIKLFAAIYSGIVCSGCAYYISGLVMQERGPVFVTAFNPLGMVIIAILGSCILAEKLNLGSVLGAVVIVVGLYLVIWGKSKDQNQQDQEIPLNQQQSDDMKTLAFKDSGVDVAIYHGKPSTHSEPLEMDQELLSELAGTSARETSLATAKATTRCSGVVWRVRREEWRGGWRGHSPQPKAVLGL